MKQQQWSETYRYLVFGGQHVLGGSRDLRGVYDDEVEARAVFHDGRVQHKPSGGWGEVVSVDSKGRIRQVCWFGPGGTGGPGAASLARVRRWGRR